MNQLVPSISGTTKARFTTAEFLHMAAAGAFDDMKVELIDGELQRMNPPMGGHSLGHAMVIGKLWQVVTQTQLYLLNEIGIDLGNDNIVACDVAIARRPPGRRSLAQPADLLLVVEVSETSLARDKGLKRALYAAAAIPVYWVVDTVRSVMLVHTEPVDGDYAVVSTVRFGESLAVPGTDAAIVIG